MRIPFHTALITGSSRGDTLGSSITTRVTPPYVRLVAAAAHSAALRYALPGLPAFFCQPYAVYIRPSGLANSHTVFCTLIGLGRVGDDL